MPKNIYTLGSFLSNLFEVAGYNVVQLINAVQSAKNDGTLINDPAATAKDSGVKIGSKGTEAKWSVSEKAEYQAKANDPLKFAAWTDALNAVFAKHGEPHIAEVTDAIVPQSLYLWLRRFHKSFVKPAAPVAVSAPVAKAGKRNGNIETVAVPAK